MATTYKCSFLRILLAWLWGWFMLCSLPCIASTSTRSAETKNPFITDVFSLNWGYRNNINLDGEWEFCRDPNEIGKTSNWHKGAETFHDKIQIPGAPQAQGHGEPTYRYKSHFIEPFWLRRTFKIDGLDKHKRAWLRIGGVLPAAEIYINGDFVGYTKSSRTQQRVDVTDLIKIDAENLIAIKICDFPEVRLDGLWEMKEIFMSWTGIYRPVKIEITNAISVVDAYINTDIDNDCVKLNLELNTPPEKQLTTQMIIKDGEKVIAQKHIIIKKEQLLTDAKIKLKEYQKWSPENPKLYKLEMSVFDEKKRLLDKVVLKFGMKKIETRGRKFYLNDDPVFIKCFGDDQLYPYTFAPPADVNYHLENLKIARAYGMNCAKSCVEAFSQDYIEAADEAGIMIIQEMPFGLSELRGNRCALNQEFMDYYTYELEGIVKESRNNASIISYSMSSEMAYTCQTQASFDFFNRKLPALSKELAPHTLVIDCTGYDNNAIKTDKGERVTDYVAPIHAKWFKEVLDESDFETTVGFPAILHEYNWWSCYPDPKDKSKYKDTLYIPYWLDTLLATASQNGQSELISLYRNNSLKLQAIGLKDGIEYVRRNPNIEGYILWLLIDLIRYSEGVLDDFWQPKYITAEEFSQYNGDTVILLAKDGNRCFSLNEPLKLPLSVSYYGEKVYKKPIIKWRIKKGLSDILRGQHSVAQPVSGQITDAGQVTANLPYDSAGYKIELIVELYDGDKVINSNSWPFWMFPCVRDTIKEMVNPENSGQSFEGIYLKTNQCKQEIPHGTNAIIADKLDTQVGEYIKKGGACLLLARDINIENRVCYYQDTTFYKTFRTIPWNAGNSGNSGTVINSHYALINYPHEQMCDLQFVKMITGILPMHYEPLRKYGVKPIIRTIDHYLSNRNNAYMLEFCVGEGRVLVTTLAVLEKLAVHQGVRYLSERQKFVPNYNIESLYLLQCLVDYAKSNNFKPTASVPYEEFEKYFQAKIVAPKYDESKGTLQMKND